MGFLRKSIHANSRCTTAFLEKFAHRNQFGYIKDVTQEKIDDFTSINAVSSSDNERVDAELERINEYLSTLLHGLELRKRGYYINMPKLVFVIGGYLFDPIRRERRAPLNDWKWNIDEKKLERIPPVPTHGLINFGIAANNGKIVVIGGHTILNVPIDKCYVYGRNDDQWEELPCLPNPLCGAAVTLDERENLYVFGGYDLVSGSVEFRNQFFELENLTSKKWIKLNNKFGDDESNAQAISPRARPLLVACDGGVIPPDGGLFACGGYSKSPTTDELMPIPEIICYNKSSKSWTYVADILNLKKLSSIAVDNNVLIISERQKSTNPDEEDIFIPISKYDLIHRKWLMIDKKEISDTTIQETKTD